MIESIIFIILVIIVLLPLAILFYYVLAFIATVKRDIAYRVIYDVVFNDILSDRFVSSLKTIYGRMWKLQFDKMASDFNWTDKEKIKLGLNINSRR